MEEAVLRPLYELILPPARGDFDDPLLDATRLEGEEVEAALAGRAAVRPRRTADGRVVVVSAAHPLAADGNAVGAVVVEQSTQAISGLRRRALERLLTVTLAVFCIGALVLLVYASRLARRIRRLRNEAEQAIDDIGSVRGLISGRDTADELGDLARSFAGVLDRLARYTSYLKSVGRRLAHELRTPIAVVRSSLDNLRMSDLPADGMVYVERAESGIARLNAILTRMSEADRLEHIMVQTERESFDLRAVVESCVAGYRSAYPGSSIRLAAPPGRVMVTGVPDLVAQMLDKLIENAVDFSREGAPIDVELALTATDAVLSVSNEGPPLAPETAGALFESMVSVRTEQTGGRGPHLGLGLYLVDLIARFHHGRAGAANRADGAGVVITVGFPRWVSDPA
jgi:dedicated sortase system histidine kinase